MQTPPITQPGIESRKATNGETNEIRIAIIKAKLKHYQVAKELGIHKYSLSRKLRYELSSKEKQKILNAILKLKNNNSSKGEE